MPKLFVNAEPGAILIGAQREFCRSWRNQTEVTVRGSHFIQEDSGPEIGRAIAGLGGACLGWRDADMNLAEGLGVERAVILHVDDLAMCHGANRAFLELAPAGLVTCGSVMVPCPWFREIAEAASPIRRSISGCI